MNFRMTIAYDGTRYLGFQRLGPSDPGNERTIQYKLETVLSRLLDSSADKPGVPAVQAPGQPTAQGQPTAAAAGWPAVQVTGSGRTDAGVHALGQVISVHLPEEKLRKAMEQAAYDDYGTFLMDYMNRYLPEDIAVLSCEPVPDRFHARYNAISKTYRYTILEGTVPDVFRQKYEYRVEEKLDLSAMKQAAGLLLGEHDFRSFCANKHMKKSTVRHLQAIEIRKVPGNAACGTASGRGSRRIEIDFTGDGFLQQMVRILTGTLIEVGKGVRPAESMPELLAALNREKAGYTAPAKGLCLVRVEYENKETVQYEKKESVL